MPDSVPNDLLSEDLQWTADTIRLLKTALRTHDPESLGNVHQRITLKYSNEFATEWVCTMITHLMLTEDWSWILEDGSTSPLM